jgi:hypothetical protein
MESKEEYRQEKLPLNVTTGGFDSSAIWISGRKVRVWRDDENCYGLFDLGFEEEVEVSFSKKEAPFLMDLGSVSFLRKITDTTVDKWGEGIRNSVVSTAGILRSSSYVSGCGNFYGYHEDGVYWYLSKSDIAPLEELLETYWRRRSFQMEYLYKRKNAGFFFTYAGKSYFLPRGQRLTFYRYGVEESGFYNVFGVLAPHLSSAVALSMDNKSMQLGLRNYLQEARNMSLLLGSMFQMIILYVWSFRKRGRRWFPFFKNKNLRLGLRLVYGHYLHSVLPAAERWQRVLAVSKSRGLDSNVVEGVFSRALKRCYLPFERYLNCCEELLRVPSVLNSLGQLRRLEKCLEALIWVGEKRQWSLQLMAPVEVRFESVGDKSKKFSNVITRRPLSSVGAVETASLGALKGLVGVQKGITIGEVMPPFDKRYLTRRLLISSSVVEKKTVLAGKVLGVQGLSAVAIKERLERRRGGKSRVFGVRGGNLVRKSQYRGRK